MKNKTKKILGIKIMQIVKKFVSIFIIIFLVLPANATYINKLDFTISGDFTINNDLNKTISTTVTLNMTLSGVTDMRFGNTVSERDLASWETYSTTKSWTLTSGEGKKTVYASFKNSSGDIVNVNDDIIFKIKPGLPYTTGLTFWLDSQDTASITEIGGDISIWSDKSGNNYNAVQNTALNQPNLLTNEISFNGTSDYFYLETLNYTNVAPMDGLLVCGVFKTDNTQTGLTDNWAFLDFDRSEWFNFYNKGGEYGFSYDSDGTIRDVETTGAAINDNAWHIGCASYDNTVVNDTIITIDGTTQYSGDLEPNGAQIGVGQATRYGFIGDGSEANTQNGSRNSKYYDGGIGEMFYFDTAVSDLDRKDLECYLGEKWGITVSGCPTETIKPIATIDYSPKTTTTGYVTTKLVNQSEPITITNNSGSDTYIFSDNGSFTFEYIDVNGNTGSTVATVDWIDSNGLPPIGTGSLNIAPEITSFSGSISVDLNIASGALDITTVSAIDNTYNVVGEFGKTTLSGNTWTDIGTYEMCSPVATISHRGNVNGEIQRAPRVRNKTGTGFQVKVDNYNSTIGALSTNIDYVVFNSGSYNFSGLQIQAGTSEVTTVACNASNNPGIATNINFTPNFSVAPSVLHTISSENDSTWVVSGVNANDGTRQSEPTVSTMGLVQQRSFNSCTHAPENIDYIAFEPGHYTTTVGFKIDAVRSTDSIASITSIGNPINYFSAFPSTPGVALVSQLGEDGGNGGYGQIHIGGGVLADKLYATVDEDGPGADRTHTTEVFSSVAFSDNSGQFVEDNIIIYSIDSGNDSGDFTINPNTGFLQFITAKDPGNPTDLNSDGIYEVTVSACDSHCNSKCSFQSFNVDVSDSTAPIISGTNFASGSILPGGDHNFIFNYSDDAIGIDILSGNIILEKWDGTNYNSISGMGTGTITTTFASYPSNNLAFGKYRISFNISDNNGNTSLDYENIFYIDKPELIISTGSINIGELNDTINIFGDVVTITVKTIGAPFRVKLKKNLNLELNTGEFIPYYDGTTGMGYDKNNNGTLFYFNDDIVGQEVLNVNTNGNLNTYTYTVKMGVIVEYQQAGGDYSGLIDFGIELDY